MREQIARLREVADFGGAQGRALGFRPPRHLPPVKRHCAAIGFIQPGDAGEQGRFAAARWSLQRHRLAARHAKAGSAQGAHFGVAGMEEAEEIVGSEDIHIISTRTTGS